MAQETRIAPIEFDRTPTQVLLSIAEQNQQDELMRQRAAAEKQKLEFENYKYQRSLQDEEMRRRYENQKEFNSIIQNKDWSKETTNQFFKSFIDEFGNAMNFDSYDYRTKVGGFLGKVSEYQRLRNSAYNNIDKFIESIPDSQKDGFDANAFKNDFIKNSLLRPDGQPKSLEELQKDSGKDWISETFKIGKDKYYDLNTAYKKVTSIIKDATDGKIEVKVPGGFKTIQFNPVFQTADPKTGEVKLRTDEFGYLDKKAYERLVSEPAVDALATRKAKTFIDHYNTSTKEEKLAMLGPNAMAAGKFEDKDKDGLPDMLTDADLDLVKNGFLTDQIKRELAPINSFQPESKGVTVNIGGQGNPPINAYEKLDAFATEQFNKGGKNYKYSQVNLAPHSNSIIKYAQDFLGVKNLTSADIKLIKEKDGRIGIYAAKDIKIPVKSNDLNEMLQALDGGNVLRKGGIGSGAFITYIEPEQFNLFANNILGQEAKNQAVGSNDKPRKTYNPDTGKFE